MIKKYVAIGFFVFIVLLSCVDVNAESLEQILVNESIYLTNDLQSIGDFSPCGDSANPNIYRIRGHVAHLRWPADSGHGMCTGFLIASIL